MSGSLLIRRKRYQKKLFMELLKKHLLVKLKNFYSEEWLIKNSFVKQTLQPGEEVKMPVSFYVDPSINDDENTKSIKEITLSYTFYNAE